jgi:hypothetical protein
MFPLPRFLRLVTISAKIVHWTSKGIQAIAICAALCAMAMAADDGDPAPCPKSKIPVWGTWYHGKALCFVGSDPRNGPDTTTIGTPVIPVVLRFLDSKGDVVETLDPTDPLTSNPKLSAFSAVVDSPIFQARDFKFGKTSVGTVQWIEATERASFWNYPGAKFDNWHIVMVPLLYPRQTLDVPQTDWHINSSDHLHMVDGSLIAGFLSPQLPAYEGQLPIFLVYNTNLYNPDDGAYHHNHVSSDGNNNPYIFTCYEDGDAPSPNLHPLSHEIAEYAHDPFLSNKVDPYPKSNVPIPWNPSYVFTQKDCGTGLEVGDPVGHKGTGNALSIDTSAMTYNFQNIAVASWFMDANPSFSVNGWYTLSGAINGEFAAPAPDCPSVPTHVDKLNLDNGPLQGGTTVTMTGVALSDKFTFDFGGATATGVTCSGPTTCTMVIPSHAKPESVEVIVKTPAGDSNAVAFQYYGPPHVDKVSPDSGALEGGTKVRVSGDALSRDYPFDFGGSPATDVTCSGATTCTMVTPSHKPESVDVIVKSPAGPSNTAAFKYLGPAINSFTPAVGPTTGGLIVSISGVSLSDHMTVKFGETVATKINCGSSTTDCSLLSASGSVGVPVHLTVTVDGITSAPSKDEFKFAVFPELTLISPGSGTTGTTVTLTGTGFSTAPGGTTFTFSGIPATGVTCVSATQCTAVVPGMTTQTVYVLATVDGHTSLNGVGFTNTARLPPPPPR